MQDYEYEREHRSEPKDLFLAFLAGLIIVGALMLVQAMTLMRILDHRSTADSPSVTQEEQEAYAIPNPCGLTAVECPHEPRTMEVSAYTSEVNQTDASPCIAADGSNICERYARGETLCASNDFPFGTTLGVQGVNGMLMPFTCTVVDRMNARYRNAVDIYMGQDTQAALRFGRRELAVSAL